VVPSNPWILGACDMSWRAEVQEDATMAAVRIIKKYPNRRLYDTELSRYVTLADVRELVMEGCDFRVLDTSNNEDITRSILLQIMLEEESGGAPLFSAKMLAQLIRFYGGTLQGMFARYLEESLDLFARQQHQMREAMGENPFDAMTRLAQRNMQMWNDMQETFMRAAGFTVDADSPDGKDEEKPSP
jgi:polyhydroxyalkanoate synthesis repressor PhaR